MLKFVRVLIIQSVMLGIAVPAATAENRSVRCNFYYRVPVVNSKVKPSEKSIVLVENRTEKFDMREFTISAGYSVSEYDSSSVGVAVGMKDSKKILHRVVYQFSTLAEIKNDFVGKLGFTGLHFIYHPNSDGELQYVCSIESKSTSKPNTGF
jgi:hypothetical protein